MNSTIPEHADPLAAEYVLGTLSGPARRRFARLAQSDRRIGDVVRAWEERLLPLAESVPPVAPPARVWTAILARIEGNAAPAVRRGAFWESLGWWRGLALAGLAAAFAFAIALLAPREEAGAGYVVVLAGQDAKPALIVSADRAGRLLTVKAVAAQPVAEDRSLQLWALPPGDKPRSLGLIQATGIARIPVPASDAGKLDAVPTLAVSLEPKGGSATGLPTGPVLYTGPVQRLY